MIFFFVCFSRKKIVQKWWLALFGMLDSPMMSNNKVLKFHKVPKQKCLQSDLAAQKWPCGDYHRCDDNYTTHAPV